MATLIAAYNSEGCIGRCDAKCYNAKSGICQCICGGANHGVGVNQAIDNTREMAEEWMKNWKQEYPNTETFDVLPAPVQMEMF